MDWHILDRNKTKEVINAIQSGDTPQLFNPLTSEAQCTSLPFYKSMLVYKLTNYASLPSFRMEYIGDGNSYFQIDGAAPTIYDINSKAGLTLNINTVLPYLKFFLENVNIEQGEVFLVEDIENLPFMESMDMAQKEHISQNFHAPEIDYEPTLSAFIVKCTFYFMGVLMHTSVRIDDDGVVSILDQTMLMQANMQSVSY